jgi:hypothetical protein
MDDYIYNKINNENIGDLITIYKKAFNKDVTKEYLIKKNSTDAYGLSFCGFIAYDGKKNEAAAFYGVYPCFVKYDDQLILAAQSGDTMTHPAHQGKGLFIKLALMTYEYVRNNGVKFVFGFPNQNSYPGFVKKLNWRHVEDIHAYLIRVRCLTWLRINKIFHFPESLFYRYASFIISLCRKGKVPIENSVIDGRRYAGIYRDKSFFDYKTYERSYIINICGRSVWLKPDINSLLIGDLERCSEKEFNNIIRRLKILSFILGVPYLRYHCSPSVYFEKMFEKASVKLKSSYPVGWIDFDSGLDLEKLKFTMCDNDTF